MKGAATHIKGLASNMSFAAKASAGLLVAMNTGLAKFANSLVVTDEKINQLAEDLSLPREEAAKTFHAMQAMGKTLEEIELDPRLQRQFATLKEDAAAIGIPDMSGAVEQIQSIQTEFTRARNIMSVGLQWVGLHMMENLQKPLEHVRNIFSGLNDQKADGMQNWSKMIGTVAAGVVRMGVAALRAVTVLFQGIQRLLQMIPVEVQLAGAAFAGLFTFLKLGPVGKIMIIIKGLLLLLDDFFTFLDGGESLLGDFWQSVMDMWEAFKGSGVIEAVKEAFLEFFTKAMDGFKVVIDWILEFWQKLMDSGAVQNITEAFASLFTTIRKYLGVVFDLAGRVLSFVLGKLAGINFDSIQDALVWLFAVGVPKVIEGFEWLISQVAKWIGHAAGFFIELAGWIAETYQGIVEFCQAVGEFFADLWDFITDIFSPVIEFFAGIFQGAFDIVTGIWEALPNALGRIWKRASDGIREFVRNALRIFEPVTNLIGRVGGLFRNSNQGAVGSENLTTVPRYGEGGIFHKPHIAQIAEDGAEAVIPLTKPKRAAEILGSLDLGKFSEGLGQMRDFTQAETNNNVNNSKVYNISMPMTVTVNGAEHPHKIAGALERTGQGQLRNLQGVLNYA